MCFYQVHFQTHIVSIMMALITAICFLPETLPRDVACQVKRARKAENHSILSSASNQQLLLWKLGKPLRDLSIINRSHLFRVLSLLAFFSSMVSSADQTILIYYIEERLGFRDSDVAYMFLITGTLGMLAQVRYQKKKKKKNSPCISNSPSISILFFFLSDNFKRV